MGKAGDIEKEGGRLGRCWLNNFKGLPASPILGVLNAVPSMECTSTLATSTKTSIPVLPFSKPYPPSHTNSRKDISIPGAPAIHLLLGGE